MHGCLYKFCGVVAEFTSAVFLLPVPSLYSRFLRCNVWRMVARNRAVSILRRFWDETSGEASRVAPVKWNLLSLQVCASLTYGCVPYDDKTFSCAYADKRVWRLRPPLRPSAGPLASPAHLLGALTRTRVKCSG
jgi:hypothetical protein